MRRAQRGWSQEQRPMGKRTGEVPVQGALQSNQTAMRQWPGEVGVERHLTAGVTARLDGRRLRSAGSAASSRNFGGRVQRDGVLESALVGIGTTSGPDGRHGETGSCSPSTAPLCAVGRRDAGLLSSLQLTGCCSRWRAPQGLGRRGAAVARPASPASGWRWAARTKSQARRRSPVAGPLAAGESSGAVAPGGRPQFARAGGLLALHTSGAARPDRALRLCQLNSAGLGWPALIRGRGRVKTAAVARRSWLPSAPLLAPPLLVFRRPCAIFRPSDE